jgi:hypothetical protein
MNLPEKIIALHQVLQQAQLPHAFGGALALAWCTQRARGTIDIDINIFVDVDHCELVFNSLPAGITHNAKQHKTLQQDGQVRLWWEKTPVDIFLNTTDFHQQAQQRIRWENFLNNRVPFLSCGDIAVFKAFFNRTQDWADLEAMRAAGTLNIDNVVATLAVYLGSDDSRIARLNGLR